MEIRDATPLDDEALARLFADYAQAFADDLGDQDVVGEGRVARDRYRQGALLVAEVKGVVAGCVAYEPWGNDAEGRPRARMKRMFVDPAFRGQGVGRALAEAILDRARANGSASMCLDTTASMQAATALYRRLGFTPFQPDYEAPCRDTVYLARDL